MYSWIAIIIYEKGTSRLKLVFLLFIAIRVLLYHRYIMFHGYTNKIYVMKFLNVTLQISTRIFNLKNATSKLTHSILVVTSCKHIGEVFTYHLVKFLMACTIFVYWKCHYGVRWDFRISCTKVSVWFMRRSN